MSPWSRPGNSSRSPTSGNDKFDYSCSSNVQRESPPRGFRSLIRRLFGMNDTSKSRPFYNFAIESEDSFVAESIDTENMAWGRPSRRSKHHRPKKRERNRSERRSEDVSFCI